MDLERKYSDEGKFATQNIGNDNNNYNNSCKLVDVAVPSNQNTLMKVIEKC